MAHSPWLGAMVVGALLWSAPAEAKKPIRRSVQISSSAGGPRRIETLDPPATEGTVWLVKRGAGRAEEPKAKPARRARGKRGKRV